VYLCVDHGRAIFYGYIAGSPRVILIVYAKIQH